MDVVTVAKHEFLLDGAEYFKDKKELYFLVKKRISDAVSVDISEIRICGSAYWGKRYRDEAPFEPGVSDLDVALINPPIFCRCMAEVREATKNFSDQTVFPKISRDITTFDEFRDYAFRKGIIRTDLLPDTKTRRDMVAASDNISRDYLDHFEKITFFIYDSAVSFAVKQAGAVKKFRS